MTAQERNVVLTFRPGRWLTADDPGPLLVMWSSGGCEILTVARVLELDAGRYNFRWTELPPRAAIWGDLTENEMASMPRGIL